MRSPRAAIQPQPMSATTTKLSSNPSWYAPPTASAQSHKTSYTRPSAPRRPREACHHRRAQPPRRSRPHRTPRRPSGECRSVSARSRSRWWSPSPTCSRRSSENPTGEPSQLQQERPWLFPGKVVGQHLDSERLRRRLKKLGIPGRASRASALLSLAQEVPAPVLAEMLDLSDENAAGWAKAAGSDYARYAASRA